MSRIFNQSVIAPVLAALVAFTAGYAVADEAPPETKRPQVQTPTPQQTGNASNPCDTAAQSGHQAGMRRGGREMHGQMMEDHQMGPGGSQGMQKAPGGSGGMPMGPGGMPMGPGASGGMPKGSSGKSGSMAPSASGTPMPMEGHM